MANEKSKAEQYRDERKARIAEAAKKNAKNMEKQNTAKKAVSKVISIILAAAIALGAVALVFNYYGAVDRVITIGGVGSEQKVTVAEYEYYYMQTYSQFLNLVSQYSSMGYDYGFDTSLRPSEQTTTTKDADGNEISWEKYLRDATIDNIQTQKAYYNEAVKAGYGELTEAEEAAIDKQIEDLREQANATQTSDGQEKPRYSLNAYLRMNYGGFMNARFLKKIMKMETITSKYYQEQLSEMKAGYDQTEIDKTYNKDKDSYDVVDFRIYQFSKSTLSASDGESDAALKKRQAEADAKVEKDAQDFLAAAKDEAGFVAKAKELNKANTAYDVDKETLVRSQLKSDITSNFTEEMAKWLFDDATVKGSVKMFTSADKKTYSIVVVTGAAHQVDTVSVRHILFATTDMQTGKDLSESEIAQKKKDAEAALKEFESGDKTADSFGALATELTEDTGSQATGGLYENVLPGTMVTEFDAWIFDDARTEGDTAIVETDYGYHVMYFVSKDGSYYDATIRSDMASKEFETKAAVLLDGETYEVGFGPRRLEYAEDKMIDKIMKLLSQSAAQ
ncbi:MAG: peptidylprolyl isomerase [Clostridia bacterium]|nr:peptidylprolyl isomerase [Clostridia bacterium]